MIQNKVYYLFSCKSNHPYFYYCHNKSRCWGSSRNLNRGWIGAGSVKVPGSQQQNCGSNRDGLFFILEGNSGNHYSS